VANPKVQVIIEAIDKNFDKVTGKVKTLDKSLEQVGKTSKGLGTGFVTDLASSFSVLERVSGAAIQAWQATVGELVKYGDEVKKLSTITGQSAEDTSRQIQMADDLRVSYETLARALQFASKNGIDTSTEGLIKLGEQYKNLAPGIERTKFLTDKFSKSGVDMGKILEKTEDQLRSLAANTKDGLILDDNDLKALEDYNRSLDEFNDTITATKMSLAKGLLPAFNDILLMANANITAITGLGDAWEKAKAGEQSFADYAAKIVNSTMPQFMIDAGMGVEGYTRATEDATVASGDFAEGMDDAGDSAEDLEKRLEATEKRMSSLYREISKGAQDIIRSNDDYSNSLNDLANDEAEIAQNRKDIEYDLFQFRQEMEQKMAEAKGAKERAKIADDLAKKEQDYYKQLEENEQDLKQLDENRLSVDKKKLDADAQKKYNLLEQRALIDGVINSGENEWLMEQAVNLGLITPAARDAALAQSQWADAMYASFAKTQPGMEETLRLMEEMMAYDGKTVNFGVAFSQYGSPGMAGIGGKPGDRPAGSAPRGSTNQQKVDAFMNDFFSGLGGGVTSRDSGGRGFAGTPYMIGPSAQPEMFIPKTNGTFVPNADKMGTTYNIVINNPKREAAENSIRTALKKLSYVGAAQ
jgi:hypothetical protein